MNNLAKQRYIEAVAQPQQKTSTGRGNGVKEKLKNVTDASVKEDDCGNHDTGNMQPDVNMSLCSNLLLELLMLSSYVRAMIELRADVELKDTIVVAMPNVLKGSRRTKAQRVYGALRRGADQGAGFLNMSHIKLK
ncbi:hypothetical protein Tco_0979522 [Tanacetum coccineum]